MKYLTSAMLPVELIESAPIEWLYEIAEEHNENTVFNHKKMDAAGERLWIIEENDNEYIIEELTTEQFTDDLKTYLGMSQLNKFKNVEVHTLSKVETISIAERKFFGSSGHQYVGLKKEVRVDFYHIIDLKDNKTIIWITGTGKDPYRISATIFEDEEQYEDFKQDLYEKEVFFGPTIMRIYSDRKNWTQSYTKPYVKRAQRKVANKLKHIYRSGHKNRQPR